MAEKFREPNASSIGDSVWLGCRIGNDGPRRGRFLGEMDELCIAERALAPQQIVPLMKTDRPLQADMAAK